MGFFDLIVPKEIKAKRLVVHMVCKMTGMALDAAKLDKRRMLIDSDNGRLVGYISGVCKAYYESITDEPTGKRAGEACIACVRKLFPDDAEQLLNVLYEEPAARSVLEGFMIAHEDFASFTQRRTQVGIHRILLEDYRDLLGEPDMPKAIIKMAKMEGFDKKA